MRPRPIAESFYARPDSGMVLPRPCRHPERAGQRGLQKNHHQSATCRRRDVGEGQLQFHPRKNQQRLETQWQKVRLESFNPGKHDGHGLCSSPICRRSQLAEGATFLRMENDRAVFAIGSGDYTFVSHE